MAEIPDIISAIEGYLEKNGKENNYLATKITQLFEHADSPLNLKGNSLTSLSRSIKRASEKLHKFDISEIVSSVNNFSYKLSDLFTSIKKGIIAPLTNYQNVNQSPTPQSKIQDDIIQRLTENLKPDARADTSVIEAMNHLNNFMSEFRFEILGKFFDNLEEANDIFKNMSDVVIKNSQKINDKEIATSPTTITDVNVVSINNNATSKIAAGIKVMMTQNSKDFDKLSKNIADGLRRGDDREESSGMISSIIKGIVGVTTLFAGVGFVSEFLDKTPIGRIIKEKLGDLKDKAIEVIKPFIAKVMDYAWIGVKTVFGTTWEFIKDQFSNFKFFGLKDFMGEQYEGLAVIMTKGLYYGVSGALFKVINAFSFGGLSKLSSLFYNTIAGFGDNMLLWGSKMLSPFTEGVGAIKGVFSKIEQFGDNILKFFSSGTGIFGSLVKGVTGSSRLLGGGIFKLLGGLLKNVAKRIPFIGALISFKDAYDRFSNGDITGGLISIGSGIASIFPGIGTAISIGLDVLNAVLDSKDKGQNNKGSIIGDFLSDIVVKFAKGLGNWISERFNDVLNMLPSISSDDIRNSIKMTPGIGSVVSAVDSAYNFVTGKKPTTIAVNDAAIMGNVKGVSPTVIQPSNKDQIIAMQAGGPFDMALKDMSNKLQMLAGIVAEGVQIITNASIQGSNNIVGAVVSSGGSGGVQAKQPSNGGGSRDPIGDYRIRAQRAVEYVSR